MVVLAGTALVGAGVAAQDKARQKWNEMPEVPFVGEGEYPQASGGELSIEQQILQALQQERQPTEYESKLRDYTLQSLKQQVEDMPSEMEYRKQSFEALKKQVEFSTSWLNQLAASRNLGAITGALSETDIQNLNRLQENAVSKLTEVVNVDTMGFMKGEINRLIEKGVLNKDVGLKTIAKMEEDAKKQVFRGTRDLESSRLQSQLGLQENKKNRDLEIQRMVEMGMMSREQALLETSKNQWQGAQSRNVDQQNMAMQAAIEQQRASQTREMDVLSAGIAQSGQMADSRARQAQVGLGYSDLQNQAAIAEAELKLKKRLSQEGKMYGFFTGQGAKGYSGY